MTTKRAKKYKAPTVNIGGVDKSITIIHTHKYWGKRARENVFDYGRFVYGYEAADHHRQWLTEILENRRAIIVAPRESAKTTWVCNIFMSWWISKYPYLTNAIVSVSADQARRRLRAIRDTIQNYEKYKWAFPTIQIDDKKQNTLLSMNIWDSAHKHYRNWKAWAHKNYPDLNNNHTLMAAGIDSSSVIGSRFTGLVLFDDIHDKKNVNTKETIDSVEEQVKQTYMPCIRPGGKAIIIGTRWVPDDVIGRIKEANKTTPADSKWAVSETTILKEGSEGELVSYWDSEWPMKRIREKEHDDPLTFQLMYMNNVYALSGDVFKPEYIGNMTPLTLPAMERTYVCVDPSFTHKTRSDFSVIATLGFTKTDRLYVIEMTRGRFDKPTLRGHIERHYTNAVSKTGRCDKVLIEKVGAGVLLVQDLASETVLPIYGASVVGKGDKVQRAQIMSVIMSKGDYYAPWDTREGQAHKLELLSFPTAPHDDTVDAVSLGVNFHYAKGFAKPTYHEMQLTL